MLLGLQMVALGVDAEFELGGLGGIPRLQIRAVL